MKNPICTKSLFLIIAVLLAFPLHVFGQNIHWDPAELDFGEVVIGESATLNFTLESAGPTPNTLYAIEFNSVDPTLDPPLEFTIESYNYSELLNGPGTDDPPLSGTGDPVLPVSMPAYSTLELVIEFSPLEIGEFEAYLNFWTNATPPDHDLDIPLYGTGVSAVPVPEPTSLLIVGCGILGLAIKRYRT